MNTKANKRGTKSTRSTIKNKVISHIKGASLLEMGMVVGLISIVSVGAVYSTGTTVKEVFCSTAGHLNKAMGGDGYCLGLPTDASSTLAASGAGYDNGDFIDITWPLGTSGLQSVMVPFQSGTEQAFNMVAATATGEINACYKMTPNDASVCAPFGGGTSSVSVPRGAQLVGYELTLPTNPTTEFDRSVDLSFEDGGNTLDSWTISQYREPSTDAFLASFDFEDVHFAVGTAGPQFVLVDKDGFYTYAMDLAVTPNGPISYGACQNTNPYSSPLCATPSTSASNITVQPGDDQVGFRIDLPGNIAEDVSETLDIDLTTPGYPTYAKDWTINVTREKAPGNFATAINFEDHTFPASSNSFMDYQGEPLEGTFTVPLQFTVDGKGGQEIYPCYEASEGAYRTCNVTNNSAGGVLSVQVPGNAYSVGYVVALPGTDYFSPYTRPVDLSIAYEHAPTESQDWTINIIREADTIVFNPTVATETTTAIAEDSDTKRVTYPLDKTDMNTGFTISTNSLNGHNIRPCYYRTGSTSTFCGNFSTERSIEFTPDNSITQVGFQIDPVSLTPTDTALSGAVEIILTSTADANVNKIFTVNYTRDEKTIVFDPIINVADHIIPQNNGTAYTQTFSWDLNGSNTAYTISTDGKGTGISLRPCIERRGLGGYACGGIAYSTERGAEYTYNINDITKIGYQVEASSLSPSNEEINATVDLILTSNEDPSVSKRFPITITRAGDTPAEPTVEGPGDPVASTGTGTGPFRTANQTIVTDHVYPDGLTSYQDLQSYVPFTLQGSFTQDILITTDGQGLQVQPCIWATQSATPTCNWGWSTGQKSLTIPQGSYAVGYRVNTSTAGNIDHNIGFTMHYVGTPSDADSYQINVKRTR